MTLTISGTSDQILALMKKMNLGLAVFDLNKQSFHISLNKDGNSCVQATLDVPDEPESIPAADGDGDGTSRTTTKKVAKVTTTEGSGGKNVYGKKSCEICSSSFVPKGPRSKYCPDCVEQYGRHCAEKAAAVKKELEDPDASSTKSEGGRR